MNNEVTCIIAVEVDENYTNAIWLKSRRQCGDDRESGNFVVL